MGTHSDITTCPRCGGNNLYICVTTGPFDRFSGMCLDCGFNYDTEKGQPMGIEEVNELRDMHRLKPLSNPRKPTEDWIKFVGD